MYIKKQRTIQFLLATLVLGGLVALSVEGKTPEQNPAETVQVIDQLNKPNDKNIHTNNHTFTGELTKSDTKKKYESLLNQAPNAAQETQGNKIPEVKSIEMSSTAR